MGIFVDVSLTQTRVQTEAGAEASGLPLAQGDGAIFDALMAASLEQAAATPETPMVQAQNQTLPDLPQTDSPPIMDAPSSSLAQDLEHMVQALAITAEVVVKGMSERAPVREIILKVESPAPDTDATTDLPELTALPPQLAETVKIKISTMDTHVTPDAVILSATTNPLMSTDETSEPERLTPRVEAALHDAASIPSLDHSIDQHQDSELVLGPFRAEMHGPFLNAEKALILGPQFTLAHAEMAAQDAGDDTYVGTSDEALQPFPQASVQPLAGASVEMALPTFAQVPHKVLATGHQIEDAVEPSFMEGSASPSAPDLLIKVPVTGAKTHDAEADEKDGSDLTLSLPILTHSLPPHLHQGSAQPIDDDVTSSIHDLSMDLDATSLLVAQNMPPVQPQFTRAEASQPGTDVLAAPRAQWQDERVIGPVRPMEASTAQNTVATVKVVIASGPTGETTSLPSPDTDSLLETSVRDLPLASAQVPQRIMAAGMVKTLVDTNIANPVAHTSSTSSADIRDLVKLGVRDIEVIQTPANRLSGTESQPMQILAQDLNATAPRSVNAETTLNFARDPQDQAERRAEAHDIRMRAIERQVIAAVRDGSDTIRMQLYPPGLGQVIIRLTMEGARLKLSTRASSSEAMESLRGIENDLRDALSTSGLELAGFDVSDENDEREGQRERHEPKPIVTRGAKSESFALDMNA